MIKPHQDQAYVVSLGKPESIEDLEQRDIYRMPVGNGYLKYAPEYLAVHYAGELKRVSHVDRVGYSIEGNQVITVLYLGPNLLKRKVKSGKQWNRRTWVDLDLALTEDTLLSAVNKTKAR